ncbi:hypothetical protein KIN20_005183 [Parelaphostrongylus tenuis]|uniref:SH2 domain-containing protein n=1 Tax=Parelaphostrongylus tenuis TaxID=148309 RepID=A0AAD5MKV8_PARTN|nr:hypothetical protein KIN20_005183 [Parelaphostrongylus tenuis]
MTGGQLSDQIWYWGNVDKYLVSEIMQEQPEGTFMVRDASSPGDYTLSVRFGNSTKLVRIHVYKGRCGFALESLTHDSVVSLIDFYRTRSLKCYNSQLDVCLRYPLPRRKNSIRTVADLHNAPCVSPSLPAFNADWDLRLGLERLRICQTEVDRAARLFDAVHEEKKLADQLHYEYTQAIVDLDRKVKQIEETLNTLQNCEEFSDESDLKRLQAFIANCKVMESSIKKLKEERDLVVDRRARVSKAIEDLTAASSHAKSRLVSCHNNRNQCYTELFKKGIPKSKLVNTIELSTGMLEKESMKASELLADIRLAWEPEQYLVNDPSKEAAAALILATRNRLLEKTKGQVPTDGIFLIRPSASQANKLALSVLHGGRVSHCLIEQTPQGWGFENGGVYFVTIGDFVRYYAYASLEEHNSEIKTTLTMPAL